MASNGSRDVVRSTPTLLPGADVPTFSILPGADVPTFSKMDNEEQKRAVIEVADRWQADDPGDTCFRTITFYGDKHALRYMCDLLWSREMIVCQVIRIERLNAVQFAHELLVRLRGRDPWDGLK